MDRRHIIIALLMLLVVLAIFAAGAYSWTWQRPIAKQPVTESAPTLSVREPIPIGRDDTERLLIELYQRVRPSVVSIQVIRETDLLGDDGETSPKYGWGRGAGFIIDEQQGIIVTNNHVVDGAEVIEVILWDGTVLPAELLGRDFDADAAVLRVENDGHGLASASLGDSEHLEVGQQAIAIGDPFGWQGSLSAGIISALGRSLQLGHASERVSGRFSIPDMIQTDAAVNFGSSGGPLLDSSGLVIGMTTAMNSLTGLSTLVQVLDQLTEHELGRMLGFAG